MEYSDEQQMVRAPSVPPSSLPHFSLIVNLSTFSTYSVYDFTGDYVWESVGGGNCARDVTAD